MMSTAAIGACWQPPHNAEPVTILADTPRWLRVGGVTGWLALGVTGAGVVIIWAVSNTSITLVSGIFAGVGALSSILFMLFIGSVILFMLLHGARGRTWFVRHSGLSAHTIEPVVDDAASAISGYFRGTTIHHRICAVLRSDCGRRVRPVSWHLAAQGLPTALIMLAVLLLVNNVLQNFFAPVAYGSSLVLDPLVVLLVTSGAGLTGGVALIVLAAPLTAIISRAAGRLAAAREMAAGPVTAAVSVQPT